MANPGKRGDPFVPFNPGPMSTPPAAAPETELDRNAALVVAIPQLQASTEIKNRSGLFGYVYGGASRRRDERDFLI